MEPKLMEQTETKINNRLIEIFKSGKENLLNIYFTAGYPKLDDTMTIIKALDKAGADMIEIGMPYSDPLADGPTIQNSSAIALENGMSIPVLFRQLENLRKETSIPVLLMGYINPVMQYGIENFCKKASEVGVDGIILPDLPIQEYIDLYKPIFEKYNLSNVLLVTPQTSESRLKLIDQNTDGFIYAVSTNSTTGNVKGIADAGEYFNKLKNTSLRNPLMIGFNITDKKSFEYACEFARGGIIGSAFIKALGNSTDLEEDIDKFVRGIKG